LILLSSLSYHMHHSDINLFSARLTKPIKPAQLCSVLCSVMVDSTASADKCDAEPSKPDMKLCKANSLRILLAEDNSINQKVAILMLQKLGYRADIASNGREVLQLLDRIPYDVILMDCQMPEMDGYETTRQIRLREQNGQQKRIHIIALTANVLADARKECMTAGMDDYLSKPFRAMELMVALQRCKSQRDNGDSAIATDTKIGKDTLPGFVASNLPAFGPNEQVLDGKILEENLEMGLETMNEVVGLYLTDAKEILDKLRTAIKAGNTENIRQLAHKLIGSSAVFGMKNMTPPLRAIEIRSRNGRLYGAEDLLAETRFQLKIAEKALVDYLNALQNQSVSVPQEYHEESAV
jgi:CheY-like chemotaxis protein/HPt (histidine-containing phosphotransfer) domain-containing protein